MPEIQWQRKVLHTSKISALVQLKSYMWNHKIAMETFCRCNKRVLYLWLWAWFVTSYIKRQTKGLKFVKVVPFSWINGRRRGGNPQPQYPTKINKLFVILGTKRLIKVSSKRWQINYLITASLYSYVLPYHIYRNTKLPLKGNQTFSLPAVELVQTTVC